MKWIYNLVALALSLSAWAQDEGEKPAMQFQAIGERTTLVVAFGWTGSEYYPANYLVLEGDSVSILIDTPWDDAQTEELLAWSDTALQNPISIAVITHAHNDRMGGIASLHKRGIATFIHPFAQAHNIDQGLFEPAEFLLADEQVFDAGSIRIQTVYPGDGHAPGNIIVRIGSEGIYGGCFIKSANSISLGYVGDASIQRWYESAQSVEHLFMMANWVIPGHGRPKAGAYGVTLTLLEEAIEAQNATEAGE